MLDLYENLYENIVACQDEEGEESVFHSGFPPLMAADGWDAQQQSVAFNPFDPMDQSAQHLADSGEEEWGFDREQNAEELLKQASRGKFVISWAHIGSISLTNGSGSGRP
jgi:hypothetical protein